MKGVEDKVLDELDGFVEDRMASRFKPKPKGPEVPSEKGDGMPDGQPTPGEGGLEEKVEAIGGDLSRLEPEEQAQLEALYEKMGC